MEDVGGVKLLDYVFSFPSDLMKTTAVVESLSYYKTNVLFQRIQLTSRLICSVSSIIGSEESTWAILDFNEKCNNPSVIL